MSHARILSTCRRCSADFDAGSTPSRVCPACVATRAAEELAARRARLRWADCDDCGEAFQATHAKATRCKPCTAKRRASSGLIAARGLPCRPIAESAYARAVEARVERFEAEVAGLRRGVLPPVDGLLVHSALAELVEGPRSVGHWGNAAAGGAQGEGLPPERSLALAMQLVRAGLVELEEQEGPRAAALVALPPGGGAALVGWPTIHDPAPGLDPAVQRAQAEERARVEELERARLEARARPRRTTHYREATADLRERPEPRHKDTAQDKEGQMAWPTKAAKWKDKECSACSAWFTPVGAGQGRRSKCYDCAPPKGAEPAKPAPPRSPRSAPADPVRSGESDVEFYRRTTAAAPAEPEDRTAAPLGEPAPADPWEQGAEAARAVGATLSLLAVRGLRRARQGLAALEARLGGEAS